MKKHCSPERQTICVISPNNERRVHAQDALSRDYAVAVASDAAEARARCAAAAAPVAVFCDDPGPDSAFSRLISGLADAWPDAPRIIVTEPILPGHITEAFSSGGIFDYIIARDSFRADLQKSAAKAAQWHAMQRDMKRLRDMTNQFETVDLVELKPRFFQPESRPIRVIRCSEDARHRTEQFYFALSNRANQLFGGIQRHAPDPAVEGLQYYAMMYDYVYLTERLARILRSYLSADEVNALFCDRRFDESELKETLGKRITDETVLLNLLHAIESSQISLAQTVIYGAAQWCTIQESGDTVCYKFYPRAHNDKVIIQQRRIVDGDLADCRTEGDSICAYAPDNSRLGTAEEFLTRVCARLRESEAQRQ